MSTQKSTNLRVEEMSSALLGKFSTAELYNIYDALNTRHTSGTILLRMAVTNLLGGPAVIAEYDVNGTTLTNPALAWTDSGDANYRRIASITESQRQKLAWHFRDVPSGTTPYILRSFVGRDSGPWFVLTNDTDYVEAVITCYGLPFVPPAGARLIWTRATDAISGKYTAEVTESQWRRFDQYIGDDRYPTRPGSTMRYSRYVVSTTHAHTAAPASSWHITTDDMQFVESLLAKLEG